MWVPVSLEELKAGVAASDAAAAAQDHARARAPDLRAQHALGGTGAAAALAVEKLAAVCAVGDCGVGLLFGVAGAVGRLRLVC